MIRLILYAYALALAGASVVRTSSGPVRGALRHYKDFTYYAYQGIPYAENPTGPLRFQSPVPKRSWSEILNASEPGPVCPQPEGVFTRADMSEDCLHLNIFVPANRTQEPMPVLAFVHGGMFKSNSGNIDIVYGPQLFMKRDIIYVSMNYRLGSLGYLSLETEEAPGNAGLKDLLLALKWIKKNIHNFGGSTITLWGQSSGAAMVHYMLLTEKSKGLYDKAILNSGSATNYRFLSSYPRKHTYALANELGFSTDNDSTILKDLKETDVFDIINAQENLYKNSRNIMSAFTPFVPSIEKESNDSILTRHPMDIIEAGLPQNVPILAGINSLEGAFFWPRLHELSFETLKEKFPLSIPMDIEYPNNSDMYKDLVNSISELYFGDINLTNWTLTNFYSLLSDTQYTYSVGSWIKLYKEKNKNDKLYYYLFNFDGELNWSKLNFNINFTGVAHADELGYLFVNKITKDRLDNLDKRSQDTLHNMLTLYSNFIKFGNPTPGRHMDSIVWPEYSGEGQHLVINERPTRGLQAPFAERFAFWTRVYKQYHEYVQNDGVRQLKIPSR